MNNNNPLRPAAAASSRRHDSHPPPPLLRTSAIATVLATLFSGPATAQVMRVDPVIGADAIFSNNGTLAPSGQEQSDLEIQVRPALDVTYDTARLRARGRLGLVASTYIGGDRTGTLYPAIDLGANLTAIRDFFYVDADVVASRQYANPFAPRTTSGDENAYASYAYRVAPYFQGLVPRWNLRYLLRNEFIWTQTSGDNATGFDDGTEWRIRGELASEGQRFGVAYQYERDQLKFQNEPEYVVEVGRVIGSWRASTELTFNVRGGYEWQIFPLSEGDGAIYGAGFSWRPTPRTDVTAWWEDRFFGSSWSADLSHRTPSFVVSFNSSRRLSTSTQNLLTVPRGNDVFRSLDAIFTTRIPDPIERAQAVRDLMVETGLPSSLAQPVPIFSSRIDLQEAHVLSGGFVGARNSLVADVYYLSRQAITATGERLPPTLALFTDEDQKGASLTYSRRLARSDAVNATLLWQRTEGVALATSAAESTQWTTRLQYNKQFQPRTTGYTGVRYVVYESNVIDDFNEAAVFVGINHRF